MMKNVWSAFCIILCSCNSQMALFENPQPATGRPLMAFETIMQGVYLMLGDSSQAELIISEKNAVIISNTYKHFHRLELKNDSLVNFDINNDKMVLDYMKLLGLQAEIHFDTIYSYSKEIDTLFSIGRDHILKKYNGYYFVNIKEKSYWMVFLLNLTKDTLCWGAIPPSADLLRYNFSREDIEYCLDSLGNPILTDTCSSTIFLNPNKRGLKTLVRDGKFKMDSKFLKIGEGEARK